jgi:hypothetical protein
MGNSLDTPTASPSYLQEELESTCGKEADAYGVVWILRLSRL